MSKLLERNFICFALNICMAYSGSIIFINGTTCISCEQEWGMYKFSICQRGVEIYYFSVSQIWLSLTFLWLVYDLLMLNMTFFMTCSVSCRSSIDKSDDATIAYFTDIVFTLNHYFLWRYSYCTCNCYSIIVFNFLYSRPQGLW